MRIASIALLVATLLVGCGSDGDELVSGSWCDKHVSEAAQCVRTTGGNDEWFAELSQSGDRVTGKLCEDGFGSSDCAALDGKLDGEALTFVLPTPEGDRKLAFTHDGDTLSGKLSGCSICDSGPCMCDLPITLFRILVED